MVEKRTIIEIILGLGFVIFGVIALNADNVYTCDANKIAMECDYLSKYYSLENGKCNNAEFGNKLCRTGWDPLVIAEYEPEVIESSTFKVNANGGTFSCETPSDGFVSSYTRCLKDNGLVGYLGELI